VYVGDEVRGELIALAAGSEQPYRGTVAPAVLTADGEVTFDHSEIPVPEVVGHFSFKAKAPGQWMIVARSGDAKATQKVTAKPSVPHPVVFWDFTNPPVSDKEAFSSDFTLIEDQTQRANRAVARIDLPPGRIVPRDKTNELLKVCRLPEDEKLKKENIPGVVFDTMTSPDFACDDPAVGISVVMQSSANWWMPLGDIPLKDAKGWKTYQLDVRSQEQVKAMPAALNIMFILKSNKPVKGSILFDHIGFLVR